MRIHDVLQRKPSQQIVTISPDASVRDLVALLAEYNIGALIVSRDGESLDGIVSERDVVRRIVDDTSLLDTPVGGIMTERVETCDPGQSLDALMALMTEHRIRHVPVLEDGRLRGIISIGDVVKNRIEELEFERDQLDSYVHQQ